MFNEAGNGTVWEKQGCSSDLEVFHTGKGFGNQVFWTGILVVPSVG